MPVVKGPHHVRKTTEETRKSFVFPIAFSRTRTGTTPPHEIVVARSKGWHAERTTNRQRQNQKSVSGDMKKG
jgi:hypothetical protein